jgi:hypothetical protein
MAAYTLQISELTVTGIADVQPNAVVTIPVGITKIDAGAFYGQTNIVQVILPSSLGTIENSAFYGCSSLTSINLHDTSLGSLNSTVFEWCSALTSLQLPNTTTYIGTGVIRNSGVTSISIPSSVTGLNSFAFEGTALTSIVLPDSISSLPTSIFRSSAYLTSVKLPANITVIPDQAFMNCYSLTSLQIPAGVTSINSQSFINSGITKLIFLGNAPTTIGLSAFQNVNATAYRSANATGWGSSINDGSTTLTVALIGTPSAPTITTHSMPNTTTLLLYFNAPSIEGDAPIISYTASATGVSGSGATSPLTITVSPGTAYSFTMYATNAGGDGAVSSAYSLTTPTDVGSGGGSGSSGDSGSGGGSGTVPCFFGDAPVLTAKGYVRMDSLKEGDKVLTPEGAEVAVERAKCYRVAAGSSANPYVIPKGRFGATQKLLISPDHRVQTAAGMVPAKELGLKQEAREGFLTYYNLELAGGANMVVAGVAVESLAPVHRMVVPRAVFERLIATKYGGRGATEVAQMIARTCRMLEGDRVEIPVMRR